jgi:hypothetical protein
MVAVAITRWAGCWIKPWAGVRTRRTGSKLGKQYGVSGGYAGWFPGDLPASGGRCIFPIPVFL